MRVPTTSWSKLLDEITLSRTAAACRSMGVGADKPPQCGREHPAALPGFSLDGQACGLTAQMNKSLQRTRRLSLVGDADVTGGVPLNFFRSAAELMCSPRVEAAGVSLRARSL